MAYWRKKDPDVVFGKIDPSLEAFLRTLKLHRGCRRRLAEAGRLSVVLLQSHESILEARAQPRHRIAHERDLLALGKRPRGVVDRNLEWPVSTPHELPASSQSKSNRLHSSSRPDRHSRRNSLHRERIAQPLAVDDVEQGREEHVAEVHPLSQQDLIREVTHFP